jgi:membrane protease subunit (stomatin/prohibitin family)
MWADLQNYENIYKDNMDIKINEVYTFKITSGEEVVAKVANVTDKYIELSDPLSVAPGPQGMGLMQTVFTGEPGSPIQLNINTVTMYTVTEENIKVKYIETTTGLKVPSKKIVLG